MTLPDLPSIAEIHARLGRLFPPGLEMRGNLVREMAAKTVFVFLYGGMIEGSGCLLRPSHVYFFTEEQALRTSDDDRKLWVANSRKPGFRPHGTRWYADTTREPIRDETIRYGLLEVGAVTKLPGLATTSSLPIYALKTDFAAIFDPSLDDAALEKSIKAWQRKHLTGAARARMAMLSSGMAKASDEVLVARPGGLVAKLSPGPSSLIAKAVSEEFAPRFLDAPVLLWLSESGAKVRYLDEKITRKMGLKFDQSKILPDIILASIGESGDDTCLVFIEVVASDGPMSQSRRQSLLEYIRESKFPETQCLFGTAFEDRADRAFKKCLPDLAWGTFAWFRSEPDRLVWLHDKPIPITGFIDPVIE